MLKKVTFTISDESMALDKAAELLKLPIDKITLNRIKRVMVEGVVCYEYEAAYNVNLGILGKDYLVGILTEMGIKTQVEFRVIEDDEISFKLNTPNNALLIGKEGKNLSALLTMLKCYLQTFLAKNENIRVGLDIGNYQDNHKRTLEILAVKTAKEVQRTKLEVKLDPMKPNDRRIIHSKLSDWSNVETVSSGDGENRAITIKYNPNKK